MTFTSLSRILLFCIVAVLIGRLFTGVAVVWMTLFFLFLTMPMPILLFVMGSLAVDLFFFLPLGMSLLVVGGAGVLFPYVYAKSLLGLVKTIVFFSLFSVVAYGIYPHFSPLALGCILFFSFLTIRSSLNRSHVFEIGSV
ncbi:MAG: hypothetical protein ABI758_01860 [Candidatus Woesebacteria bacterium]